MYSKITVTVKQTSYRSSYIFKSAWIRLKWEQAIEVASFSQKELFQNTFFISNEQSLFLKTQSYVDNFIAFIHENASLIVISSYKIWRVGQTNSVRFVAQKMLQWHFVKIFWSAKNVAMKLWKVYLQYTFIKALENGFNQLSLCSSKAFRGMEYQFQRRC